MSVLEMAGWALRFKGGGERVASFCGSGRLFLSVEEGFDGGMLNAQARQRKGTEGEASPETPLFSRS